MASGERGGETNTIGLLLLAVVLHVGTVAAITDLEEHQETVGGTDGQVAATQGTRGARVRGRVLDLLAHIDCDGLHVAQVVGLRIGRERGAYSHLGGAELAHEGGGVDAALGRRHEVRNALVEAGDGRHVLLSVHVVDDGGGGLERRGDVGRALLREGAGETRDGFVVVHGGSDRGDHGSSEQIELLELVARVHVVDGATTVETDGQRRPVLVVELSVDTCLKKHSTEGEEGWEGAGERAGIPWLRNEKVNKRYMTSPVPRGWRGPGAGRGPQSREHKRTRNAILHLKRSTTAWRTRVCLQ